MNDPPDPENARTLEILDIVQRNEQVSQRHLARQLGVALALGLANSYLKRCVKKGWVKVQQARCLRQIDEYQSSLQKPRKWNWWKISTGSTS